MLALVTRNADQRRSALSEAAEVLRGNSENHNFMRFYARAVETCLQVGEWDRVDRYDQTLEDHSNAEPLPMTNLRIAHGRTLAAYGRGRVIRKTKGEGGYMLVAAVGKYGEGTARLLRHNKTATGQ